jgi:hypothetical protein
MNFDLLQLFGFPPGHASLGLHLKNSYRSTSRDSPYQYPGFANGIERFRRSQIPPSGQLKQSGSLLLGLE